MDNQEALYFAHDKEQLLNALARFDGDITVEDVTDGASQSYNAKYYHTVLLQILLEAICKSFVQDEKQKEILLKEICKRLSKLKLVNPSLLMDMHNPLRIEIKQKFFDFVKQVLKEVIPEAEVDASAISFLESSNLSADPKFCYYKCFDELQEIGRGGFGVVYKAKDNLTDHIYAVKKISFKCKNDASFLEVLREAKNIGALDHPNVVHYNSAWLEVVPTNSDSNQFIRNNDNSNCEKTRSEVDGISFCEKGVSAIVITDTASYSDSRTVESCVNENTSDLNSSKSFDSVIFSNSAEYFENVAMTVGSYNKNTDNDTSDSDSSGETSDSDSGDETSARDSSDETTDVATPSRVNFSVVRGMLYIQMEFCDCDLRFWLEERARGNDLPFDMDINEIFSNILHGLVHIHSKGIIHRDLKPQNIFYSKASNVLKIGDFGLATLPDSSKNYLVPQGSPVSSFHSANIGTVPYAAPEQIASKSYDSKVDIYSLGIILIELMNTFSTSMEFFRTITVVKNGTITEEMKKLPNLVSIVSNLISTNPKDRMSAEKILAYCEEDVKAMYKEMTKLVREKETVILEQGAVIQKQEKEIQRLRAIIGGVLTD